MSDVLEVRLGEPDRRPAAARMAAKAAGVFGYEEPYVQRRVIPASVGAAPVLPRAGRRVEVPVAVSTRPDWARGYSDPKPVDGRFRTSVPQDRYERRLVRAGLPAVSQAGPPANRRPVEAPPPVERRPDFVRAWE